jgi:hypothetical protein
MKGLFRKIRDRGFKTLDQTNRAGAHLSLLLAELMRRLPRTPAIAAGMTDHRWCIEESTIQPPNVLFRYGG